MTSISHSQKIFAVETTNTADFEQVVVRVHWEQRAQQHTDFAVANRVTELALPSAETFVSFDQLTEQQVLQWIQDDPQFAQHQQELDQQLAETHSDTINRAPPWEDVNDTVFSRAYVVVIDDQVVWGPQGWNTFSINQALWQHGIHLSIPNLVAAIPETEPLQVGPASVYRAQIQSEPPADPVLNYISELTWDFSSGIAVASETATPKSLEDLQESVVSWIVSTMMSTPHQNTMMSHQYAQRTDLLLLAQTTSDGDTVQIMDDEHNLITVTHQEIVQRLDQLTQAYLSSQAELGELIHSVRSATSVQAVVDIYQGLNPEVSEVPVPEAP